MRNWFCGFCGGMSDALLCPERPCQRCWYLGWVAIVPSEESPPRWLPMSALNAIRGRADAVLPRRELAIDPQRPKLSDAHPYAIARLRAAGRQGWANRSARKRGYHGGDLSGPVLSLDGKLRGTRSAKPWL